MQTPKTQMRDRSFFSSVLGFKFFGGIVSCRSCFFSLHGECRHRQGSRRDRTSNSIPAAATTRGGRCVGWRRRVFGKVGSLELDLTVKVAVEEALQRAADLQRNRADEVAATGGKLKVANALYADFVECGLKEHGPDKNVVTDALAGNKVDSRNSAEILAHHPVGWVYKVCVERDNRTIDDKTLGKSLSIYNVRHLQTLKALNCYTSDGEAIAVEAKRNGRILYGTALESEKMESQRAPF